MIEWDTKKKMEVKSDFLNRSKIYLAPSLSLLKTYSTIVKCKPIAISIGVKKVQGLTLFFKSLSYDKLLGLIDELKQNNEYLEDIIISDKIHAVVLKQDKINIEHFIKGYYSKIYKQENLVVFNVDNQILKKAKKVLLKDPSYKEDFYQYMKSTFEVVGSLNDRHQFTRDLLDSYEELDLPPNLNIEIYNYES